MNKNDLIATVASSAGLSKGDAAKAVDSVFSAITDALKGGSEVRLVGFGTFNVARRAASQGRNPRTGEAIQIAAPSGAAGFSLRGWPHGSDRGGVVPAMPIPLGF